MKSISIVVPAYNEESCIEALVGRVKSIMDTLPYNYELIIVDDGSKDNSFNLIKNLALIFPFVKGIKLSRNMGHQAALDCGLKHASGDAVISMDADLQHPPEMISRMIDLWEKGYDVVVTQKTENGEAGLLYKIFADTFYKLFNRYSQIKLTPSASDFRLISKRCLKAVLNMPEYHRFYRGLIPFVGFNSTSIEFVVQKRHAGKRKYNFKQSLRLASDGLFSFSDFALKIPFVLGTILLSVAVIYLLISIFRHIFAGEVFVHGWMSIIIILIFSISIQLIFMGILGIYVGKIFFEVKRRPIFFIQETTGDFIQHEMARFDADFSGSKNKDTKTPETPIKAAF
jgi:polyisoprenyl-phosphate glycosyltransferase